MKIQLLFDDLEKITESSKSDFEDSGMINRFQEMKYGFFPLGWGMLTENNKIKDGQPTDEINEGGIMVLGNDFGTVTYANKYSGAGELDSVTARNLLNEKVGLNPNNTFFTNFYLGVRTHPDATMIKRVEKLTDDYRALCYKFFVTQLELQKPSTIICLGHEVKDALIDSKTSFEKWEPKSKSIKKIHADDAHVIESDLFENKRFILIPHPCDLRNFNEEHRDKLNRILNNL